MRLIDADALKQSWDVLSDGKAFDFYDIDEIANAPTIDAVPMRHGYWEFKDDFGNRNYDFVAVCSRCGKEEKASGYSHSEWRSEWRYCNACGAQLDEVRE